MAKFNKAAKKVGEFFQMDDWAQAFTKKGVMLESNKAINPLPKAGAAVFPKSGLNAGGMMGSIPRSISNIRHGEMDAISAIKAAHTNADGTANIAAIAGSYMGASAAYRVASGGGVHRDAKGNSNLIGVPFI